MSPADILASAAIALFPAYAAEARRRTDDGLIWPFSRAAMRNPEAIRERLAGDLRDLLRARGAGARITTEDYLLLGWRRQQVERHGLAAARLLEEAPSGAGGHQNPANGRALSGASGGQSTRARDLANEVA